MLTEGQKNLRDEAITEALKQIKQMVISQGYISTSYQSPLATLTNAVEKLTAIE